MNNLPALGTELTDEHRAFLSAFSKSCRRSIIEMTANAQSGHPGGSLSSIDYLAALYGFIVSQTGESVVVSNGHISPAIYSVLAELGYIPKDEVVKTFRKIGSIYEGHVTRHVPGVWYGTGPLGIGVSVASGFALGEKLKKSGKKVFALVGDGEAEEGQVYEMMNFAHQYSLDNMILFMDYNKVQLSDSLHNIINIDYVALFKAGGWEVIEINAHDSDEIWNALSSAHKTRGKPTLIVGHSIMGKGAPGMEEEGAAYKATWHGKAPEPALAQNILKTVTLTKTEQALIDNFVEKNIRWRPEKPHFSEALEPVSIDQGEPIVYDAKTVTDCRTAYGQALLDLAQRNKNVLALTADLRASVMTKFVYEKLPAQHVDVGVAEQHMVSCSGGLSLDGFIPFCSTFGAFMTSRAKDQARVNDINRTNVKMVATHCGLSVGEDGPTHQVIDDMGSFLGLLHTMIIEPADPNHTDRIIRYVAVHYGNFYVRMGRHKFPVITKEDGTVYYDKDYVYEYGKCDLLRAGDHVTIAATGAMVTEVLKACEKLKETRPDISVEIVSVSSIKKFDQTLIDSIKKTRKVITVEDHNTFSGLGSQLARYLATHAIPVEYFKMIGVEEYQLSGTWNELYESAGISAKHIEKAIFDVLTQTSK